MGNQASALQKPSLLNYLIMDYRYTKVWIRKTDLLELFQQYPITANTNQDIQSYKKMLDVRISEPHIVKVIYFSHEKKSFSCESAYQGMVLIERISFRLCQFQKIPYLEGLSILKHCLEGYNALYSVYGVFNIQSTMIGLDSHNSIKVWHHTDLGAPNPENPHCHNIIIMIKTLISCVLSRCQHPYGILSFSDYIEFNNIILYNFQRCDQALRSYCEQFNIKNTESFPKMQKFLKQSNLSRILNLTQASSPKYSSKSKEKFSFRSNSYVWANSSLQSIYTHQSRNSSQSKKSHSLCRSASQNQNNMPSMIISSSIRSSSVFLSHSSPLKQLGMKRQMALEKERRTQKSSTKQSKYTKSSGIVSHMNLKFNKVIGQRLKQTDQRY